MSVQRIDATQLSESIKLDCDVVIVGSGAGGAPLAWRLVQQGLNVVLLEEGQEFRATQFGRRVWESTRSMYREAGGTVALGNPTVAMPIGRTWGGTTTINSGTCLRMPEFVHERWVEEGFPHDVAALAPFYTEVEEIQHVEPVADELMAAGNTLFRKGAEKLGYKGQALHRNTRDCKGTGLCAFGCPTDGKQAMGLTFLPQAEELGLRGVTGVRVLELMTRFNRATGVVGYAMRSGDATSINRKIKIEVKAKRTVLSMGSVNTPYFLLKNQVANSSGQIGRNLRIHPAGKILGVFDEPIHGWTGVPQAYWVDEFIREGIVFEGAFIPPAALAFAMPAMGAELKRMMANYDHIGGFGVMVSDSSAGRVRVGPTGPLTTYKLNKEDTARFHKGVAIGAKTYLAAGAKEVITCVYGHERIQSDADIDRLQNSTIKANDLELIAFHPVGTARMGTDPRTSVVSPTGQTHDIEDLYVADASIFHASPSVNPQLTIMALSLMIGDAMAAGLNA